MCGSVIKGDDVSLLSYLRPYCIITKMRATPRKDYLVATYIHDTEQL